MFLKRRARTKDGKTHHYYSVCESLRVHRARVVQRQVLHLGELNTTQLDSWQHSIQGKLFPCDKSLQGTA